MATMDQSRLVLFIIIFLIIMVMPDGNSSSGGRSHRTDAFIAQEKRELDALRNSTFGHPGNNTGLLAGGESTPPAAVRDVWRGVKEMVLGNGPGEDELGHGRPVYANATGNLYGKWKRVEIPNLPIGGIANATYERNVTDVDGGKVTVSVEEAFDGGEEEEVRDVQVVFRIKDEQGGREVDVGLKGLHWVGTGEMVVVSSSDRFAGIYSLPYFVDDERQYNQSKEVLIEELSEVIQQQEKEGSIDAPWLATASDALLMSPNPKCEYIAYIQLHPVELPSMNNLLPYGGLRNKMLADTLRMIERELRWPTGAPLPSPPPIEATALIYSPTCKVVLKTERLEGQRLEKLQGHARSFGLVTAAITAVQIWLLIRQMNETNTPSTVSRISAWTIAIMCVVDGYFFCSFMVVAILVQSSFYALATASFCFLVLATHFELRFLATAYRVQRPERQSAAATPPAPTPAPVPATPEGLPLPATAVPQTPVVIPPNQDATDADEDARSELGTLHYRLSFALVATLFLTLHATSWPPFFRDLFVQSILLITNSYWVPQIYRNVMRGCRKAFQWEFVFGTSFCRILGTLYLYLYPNNVFHSESHPKAAAIVVGWVWIQCCALLSQELFGPRFLIPPRWLPPVYDYHSALPIFDGEDRDMEAGTPLSPRHEGGTMSFDCAICMQSVEVPTREGDGRSSSEGGRGVGLLGRRGYMVTPCRHVFHSNCLEGWMRFRLQCPICRNSLPPL